MSGYVRGNAISANQLVQVVNYGTYRISKVCLFLSVSALFFPLFPRSFSTIAERYQLHTTNCCDSVSLRGVTKV